MKKFKINVKEVLEREVEIIADTEEKAIEKIYSKYNNEEIVLDETDFVGSPIIEIKEKNRG